VRGDVEREVRGLAGGQLDSLELHEPAHRLLDVGGQLAGGAGVDLGDVRSGDVSPVLDAEADQRPCS
jgi:hypothetical protein